MSIKTLIICFSQTGNTRKVAEGIREGVNKVADQGRSLLCLVFPHICEGFI